MRYLLSIETCCCCCCSFSLYNYVDIPQLSNITHSTFLSSLFVSFVHSTKVGVLFFSPFWPVVRLFSLGICPSTKNSSWPAEYIYSQLASLSLSLNIFLFFSFLGTVTNVHVLCSRPLFLFPFEFPELWISTIQHTARKKGPTTRSYINALADV